VAHYWNVHARSCSSENVQKLSMELIYDESKVACAMQIRDLPGSKFEDYSKRPNRDVPSLWVAVMLGLDAILPKLIGGGLGINGKNSDEETPLHAAAKYGYEAVTRLLIEAKAFVNSRGGSEFTLLHMTAHYGHSAVAKLLLEAGAGLDSCTDREETPFPLSQDGARSLDQAVH
jgi:ankyrin repeat protein